jgi:acetyl esterase
MRWYWTQYVGADFENAPPGAAPLRAELRGLPPIYLNLAELDPLADDTRLLAAGLAAANVPYALHAWPGASHGFLQLTRDVALARRAMDAAGTWLRKRAS